MSTTRHSPNRREDLLASPNSWLLAGFLVLALALGGAGSHYPLLGLIIELASLPVLFCFAAGFGNWTADQWSRPAVLLLSVIVLAVGIQLVPLPASLQQALPGRTSYVE